MKTIKAVGGWIVALILGICAGLLLFRVQQIQQQLGETESTLGTSLDLIAALREDSASKIEWVHRKDVLTALETMLEACQSGKMLADGAFGIRENLAIPRSRLVGPVRYEESIAALNESIKILEQELDECWAARVDEGGASIELTVVLLPSAATIGGGDVESNIGVGSRSTAQIEAVAHQYWIELLLELNLGPEEQERILAAMAKTLGRQQQVGLDALKAGNVVAKTVFLEQEVLNEGLREELEGLLAPEALGQFDAFVRVAERKHNEKNVYGSMGIVASRLSNETRLLASQVIAEELTREFEGFAQSSTLYTMENINSVRRRAYAASRGILATRLTEDQMDRVEGYFTFVRTVIGGDE